MKLQGNQIYKETEESDASSALTPSQGLVSVMLSCSFLLPTAQHNELEDSSNQLNSIVHHSGAMLPVHSYLCFVSQGKKAVRGRSRCKKGTKRQGVMALLSSWMSHFTSHVFILILGSILHVNMSACKNLPCVVYIWVVFIQCGRARVFFTLEKVIYAGFYC